MIPVEQGDNIGKKKVPRLQHTVGTQMRMRMRPGAARDLDIDDPLRPEGMKDMARLGLEIVLPDPRPEAGRHPVEGRIDSRRDDIRAAMAELLTRDEASGWPANPRC